MHGTGCSAKRALQSMGARNKHWDHHLLWHGISMVTLRKSRRQGWKLQVEHKAHRAACTPAQALHHSTVSLLPITPSFQHTPPLLVVCTA